MAFNVDYEKIFKNKRCQRDPDFLIKKLEEANLMFKVNELIAERERELIKELDKEIAELDAKPNTNNPI